MKISRNTIFIKNKREKYKSVTARFIDNYAIIKIKHGGILWVLVG